MRESHTQFKEEKNIYIGYRIQRNSLKKTGLKETVRRRTGLREIVLKKKRVETNSLKKTRINIYRI